MAQIRTAAFDPPSVAEHQSKATGCGATLFDLQFREL
jgi:hypothetical protein